MDEDWTPQGRDRRTADTRRLDRKFERRDMRRHLVKQAQSPCADRGSTWLERGHELFYRLKVGLIKLLRYFGVDTDESSYRAIVNAEELQIVRRGSGCALWWHGSDGWWYVGLNHRNHLAGEILAIPAEALKAEKVPQPMKSQAAPSC